MMSGRRAKVAVFASNIPSASPTAVGKARGARIRTGRLYSCTRTIDDKPRNYGSAKIDAEKAKAKAEV